MDTYRNCQLLQTMLAAVSQQIHIISAIMLLKIYSAPTSPDEKRSFQYMFSIHLGNMAAGSYVYIIPNIFLVCQFTPE